MSSPPSLDTTLGPAFFGTIAVSGLYGIMALQTFVYYQNSWYDGWGWKSLVFGLCILESTRLSFILHAMYEVFVANYGNIRFLSYPTWSMVALVFPGNFVELIVRSIFAHRIHLLCGRHRRVQGLVVPILIIGLSVTACICESIFAGKRLTIRVTEEVDTVSVFLYVHFSCAMVADFLAAAWLCTVLFHSRTGVKRTDSIIRILIAFSINTGVLTCLCTTACFITYIVWPSTLIWMGLLLPKSQLYANSFLATLNARESFRQRSKSSSARDEGVTVHLPPSMPSGLDGSGTYLSHEGLKESTRTTRSVSSEIGQGV